MDDQSANARRLLALLERLRPQLLGPAFRRLSDLELSPAHLRLLRLLGDGQVVAMKDLADQLCVKPPSLTPLTRRLVATGLVARQPHAEDSRVVLLALTAAGDELHQALVAEQQQHMGVLLARLSPAEQQQFLDLLERALTPE